MMQKKKSKNDLANISKQISLECDSIVKVLSRIGMREKKLEPGEQESLVLRERISNLAAQMAAMVAAMEGETSPIREMLAQKNRDKTSPPEKSCGLESPEPLADQIRMAQRAID